MKYAISVKESLTFGWTTFRKRPWFFVATLLIYLAVQFLVAGIQKAAPGSASFLLSIMVSVLLYAGIVRAYLNAHDDVKSARFEDLWNPGPFLPYLGVSILMFLIIGAGVILLIVPGIILGLMLSLAGFLTIERHMRPIAALKESYRLTKGNLWPLFVFWCIVTAAAIIGMIPFMLGLLVVAPVAMLANVHIYRTLAGNEASTEANEVSSH